LFRAIIRAIRCNTQGIEMFSKINNESKKPISDSSDATTKKDLVQVKKLVSEAKAEHNSNWRFRISEVLRAAALSGQEDIVTYLLSEKIEANADLLNEVIKLGHVNIVRALLKEPRSPNTLTTSLFLAIDTGDIEVIELLLKAGADANVQHQLSPWYELFPIVVAAANHDTRVMELLALHGASISNALTCAQMLYKKEHHYYNGAGHSRDKEYLSSRLKEEYRCIIKYLLDFAIGIDLEQNATNDNNALKFLENLDVGDFNFVGLSVNGVPVTEPAVQKQKVTGIDEAMFTPSAWDNMNTGRLYGRNIPRFRALQKRLQAIEELRGKLIDENGIVNCVPLHIAARYGHLVALQKRLQVGVNPNEESPVSDNLPLVDAAEFGHQPVVEALLTLPQVRSNQLGIMQALERTNNEVIAGKLRVHLSVESKDAVNNTQLHYAALRNNVAEIRRLIALNADRYAKNNNGETPFIISVNELHLAAVQSLITKESLVARRSYSPDRLRPKVSITPIEEYLLRTQWREHAHEKSIILSFLLDRCLEWGIPVDILHLVRLSIETNNLSALKLLIPKIDKKEGWDTGLFHLAVNYPADLQALAYLKEQGADINCVDPEYGSLVYYTIQQIISLPRRIYAGYSNDLKPNILQHLSNKSLPLLKKLNELGASFAAEEDYNALILRLKQELAHYEIVDEAHELFSLISDISVKSAHPSSTFTM